VDDAGRRARVPDGEARRGDRLARSLTTTPIDTARLRLDPLTLDDADDLFAVLDDPRLHTFTGGAPMTRDALEKWIEFVVPGRSPDGAEVWRNWVIRVRDEGRAIGTAQATIVGDEATLAWTIGTAWQGHGYAKEAAAAVELWVATSGVVWFRAAIHPEHAASAAVARSIGLAPTSEVVDGEVVWGGVPPAA
jgi:RimJ/RimL family protein N-acetyltransferase